MRNKLLGLSAFILGFNLFAGVVAAAPAQKEVGVMINGKQVAFPDAKPFMDENNRTLVPVRFIAENLGAKVSWNKPLNRVDFAMDGAYITLTIGENNALVNGNEVEFDTAAIVKSGRTFVPLRFVSEALDMKVGWDGRSRTVFIDDPAYLEAIDHYINEVLETKEEKERILEELRNLPAETEDGTTFEQINKKMSRGNYWGRMLPEVAETAKGYLETRYNFDYRSVDEKYRLDPLQYHATHYIYKGERLTPDKYIDSLISDQKKDKVIVETKVITDPTMVYNRKDWRTMVRARVFTRYLSHNNLPEGYTLGRWYVQDIDLYVGMPATNAKITWETTEYSYLGLVSLNDLEMLEIR